VYVDGANRIKRVGSERPAQQAAVA
jgi:hypothetical protein